MASKRPGSDSIVCEPKKKHKHMTISVQQKVDLLRKLDKGVSVRTVCQQYNIGMGTNNCWSYLASLGVHHYTWHDPLLAEGLAVCAPLNKTPCVDVDEEEFFHPSVESLVCSVSGCKKTFSTVVDYAAHQRSCHQHVCSSCKQSFPTNHLLDLHLLEGHDTLFQLMAEKTPQYQCFLETCREKFRNPTERKSHCIQSHKFPSNFRFDTSWRKLEKTNRKKKKTDIAGESPMECEVTVESSPGCGSESTEAAPTHIQNENVRKMPKVPHTLSFGAGVARGFSRGSRGNRGHGRKNGPHWHQRKHVPYNSKTNIEEVNMNDLEAALPGESQSV